MKMDRCVQFDQLEGKKSHCQAIKLPLLCLFFAKQVRTYPRYFSRLCRICVFAICQVTPEIPEKNTIGRFSNVNVLFLRVVEFCPPGRSEPDNSNHNDSFPCSGFLALMVMSPLALTMWKLFASHLQRRVSNSRGKLMISFIMSRFRFQVETACWPFILPNVNAGVVIM